MVHKKGVPEGGATERRSFHVQLHGTGSKRVPTRFPEGQYDVPWLSGDRFADDPIDRLFEWWRRVAKKLGVPHIPQRCVGGVDGLDDFFFIQPIDLIAKDRFGFQIVGKSFGNGRMEIKLSASVLGEPLDQAKWELEPVMIAKEVVRQGLGFDEQQDSQHRVLPAERSDRCEAVLCLLDTFSVKHRLLFLFDVDRVTLESW